jgi:hypothetical protein
VNPTQPFASGGDKNEYDSCKIRSAVMPLDMMQTQNSSIQFTSHSTVYIFYHVPFQVFNELMAAPSKGDYYHRYIEGNYKG